MSAKPGQLHVDGDTSVLPFAVYRIGRSYLVRTAELRHFVGCDPTPAAEDPSPATASMPRHSRSASPLGKTKASADPELITSFNS